MIINVSKLKFIHLFVSLYYKIVKKDVFIGKMSILERFIISKYIRKQYYFNHVYILTLSIFMIFFWVDMNTFIVFIIVLLMIGPLYFLYKEVKYKLAEQEILFSYIKDDHIIFTGKGSKTEGISIQEIIINGPRCSIYNNIVVEESSDTKEIRWIGFFGKLIEFEIQYAKYENGKFIKGTKKIKGLRVFFPTVIQVSQSECKDGVQIDLELSIDCRVVDPRKLIVDFEGKYYSKIEDLLRSLFETFSQLLNSGDIISLDRKAIAKGLMDSIKHYDVKENIGVDILRVIVSGVNYSSSTYQEKVEAREGARIDAETNQIKAQSELDAADKRAAAASKLQRANTEDLKDLVGFFLQMGVPIEAIPNLVRSHSLTESGGLAVLFDNQGQPIIPTKNNPGKKGKNK